MKFENNNKSVCAGKAKKMRKHNLNNTYFHVILADVLWQRKVPDVLNADIVCT